MKQFVCLMMCVLTSTAIVDSEDSVRFADLAQKAIEQSKITLPGSVPFHLKAKIIETTNPDSDYKADIEEYWVSPGKFYRTITSPEFSQTLIVDGDKLSEQNKGDYFPWWLDDLVTAIFDPLPMLDSLQKLDIHMARPSGSAHSTSCARMQTKIGVPSAENDAFSVFCLAGSEGLLESAVTPGYEAEFENYQDFMNKRVARQIVIDPEPGTTIEATITDLVELTNPEESMFAVQQSTPEEDRIEQIRVSEATVRPLFANTPDITWPAVRGGKTSGVLSMYISVDRTGHVREAWPLNSDNPGLEDTAREQVMKWQFKPAQMHGVPVQIQSTLTLPFNSKVDNPIPILSDSEARSLATKIIEPVFPPGTPRGTEVQVQVGVSLDGTINGVGNPYKVPTPLFMAAYRAVRQWQFRPYLRNGKADVFGADIVFHVK